MQYISLPERQTLNLLCGVKETLIRWQLLMERQKRRIAIYRRAVCSGSRVRVPGGAPKQKGIVLATILFVLVHLRSSNLAFFESWVLRSSSNVATYRLDTLDSVCSFFGRHRLKKQYIIVFSALTRGGTLWLGRDLLKVS